MCIETVTIKDVMHAQTSEMCRGVLKKKTAKVIRSLFGEGHQYELKELRLCLIVKEEPGTIRDI